MTTTAKQIIQAVAARRTANDPEKLFSAPELIGVLDRRLEHYYALIYAVAPEYFGTKEEIACTDLGWPFPATAIAAPYMVETVAEAAALVFALTDADVAGIEVLEGLPPATYADLQELLDDYVFTMSELEDYLDTTYTDVELVALPGVTMTTAEVGGRDVAIVPLSDRQAEEGKPRIYPLGRFFHSVGEAGDPQEELESLGGDPLLFYFSIRHPSLDPAAAWDHATNTLDASWPEHRNKLLVAELALYLRVKDGAGAPEVQEIKDEIKDLTALFVDEAQMSLEYGVSRRWSDRPDK